MAQKERGALGMWWGCVCKREYFKTKEYFMQDCMMHSETSKDLAPQEIRQVREVKGSHFTPSKVSLTKASHMAKPKVKGRETSLIFGGQHLQSHMVKDVAIESVKNWGNRCNPPQQHSIEEVISA